MTSLNTEHTENGTKLTFDDGRNAGIIVFDTHQRKFQFQSKGTQNGPFRLTHEAAEFDGLAWATEYEAEAIYTSGIDGDPTWIANCANSQSSHRAPRTEAEANAHLIAAAPDLLKSLELLIYAITEGHTKKRDRILQTNLAEAQNTIAKATTT